MGKESLNRRKYKGGESEEGRESRGKGERRERRGKEALELKTHGLVQVLASGSNSGQKFN